MQSQESSAVQSLKGSKVRLQEHRLSGTVSTFDNPLRAGHKLGSPFAELEHRYLGSKYVAADTV